MTAETGSYQIHNEQYVECLIRALSKALDSIKLFEDNFAIVLEKNSNFPEELLIASQQIDLTDQILKDSVSALQVLKKGAVNGGSHVDLCGVSNNLKLEVVRNIFLETLKTKYEVSQHSLAKCSDTQIEFF
ncbi:MAG: hypothetical protein AB8B71_11360 [Paracoccaceae bacterium]